MFHESIDNFKLYEYYSVSSKEELAEFFSMKDMVLGELKQALSWSIMQMISSYYRSV